MLFFVGNFVSTLIHNVPILYVLSMLETKSNVMTRLVEVYFFYTFYSSIEDLFYLSFDVLVL